MVGLPPSKSARHRALSPVRIEPRFQASHVAMCVLPKDPGTINKNYYARPSFAPIPLSPRVLRELSVAKVGELRAPVGASPPPMQRIPQPPLTLPTDRWPLPSPERRSGVRRFSVDDILQSPPSPTFPRPHSASAGSPLPARPVFAATVR